MAENGGIRIDWPVIAAVLGMVAGGMTAWVNLNQRISALETELKSATLEQQNINTTLTSEMIEMIKQFHRHAGHLDRYPTGPQESVGGLPRPFTRGKR